MNLPEIVAYLLNHDANPNICARVVINGLPARMQGALHCAARKGDTWLATQTQLLKYHDIDIEKHDSDGKQYISLSNQLLLQRNNNIYISLKMAELF